MFIVVESGSTKADWMVLDGDKEMAYNTMGFNPYFHTKEDVLLELNDHLELDLIKEKVEEVFFYGAGCSSPKMNAVIEDALSTFFHRAEVTVDHDLSACAYACYDGEPVIACIIGTGSNSCHFDGKVVHEEVPALSFILGDEASGSYFGKAILADFLYKRVPTVMRDELLGMGLDKDVIFENVYKKSNANVYIASFMPVLIRHKNLDYSQQLIREGIQKFIDAHVKCYDDYMQTEVSFVGSVASLLQDELRVVCASNGIRVGNIIRRPLDRLVKYHKKQKQQARWEM